MDWDKLRIFHAVAQAGSFTHAGDTLHLSQSATSRQISSLEQDLGVTLFHRHARGLVLTEQGELLFRTAHDVLMQLEAVQVRLKDNKEKPSGPLIVTTTVGLGSSWLVSRVNQFLDLYPDIDLQLRLGDDDLNLSMREADVAIRLHRPTEPDLIQRKLFTVHFHLYSSAGYLKEHGQPDSLEELDDHRIIAFGEPVPAFLKDINWLLLAGRNGKEPRVPSLRVNNIVAIKLAVERGNGIALLPDYLLDDDNALVQLLPSIEVPSMDTYFTYPEELRNTARVTAFRDFLIDQAQRWRF
ncbi:MAG: LysR family transcriptional regulator [Rhizobiales bacterium]|nr:LysR family transcriptional regulator [Hyphomicrobiales bacterium]